jgi:hypothetical protein
MAPGRGTLYLGRVLDGTGRQATAPARGDFRLVYRLFAQVERIMKINDVIETARSTFVIGDTWPGRNHATYR